MNIGKIGFLIRRCFVGFVKWNERKTMGCFDTVLVPCPQCGEKYVAQSKSGPCLLDEYEMSNAPPDVLYDVNRHAPFRCKCGTIFQVSFHYGETVPFADVILPGGTIFSLEDKNEELKRKGRMIRVE